MQDEGGVSICQPLKVRIDPCRDGPLRPMFEVEAEKQSKAFNQVVLADLMLCCRREEGDGSDAHGVTVEFGVLFVSVCGVYFSLVML